MARARCCRGRRRLVARLVAGTEYWSDVVLPRDRWRAPRADDVFAPDRATPTRSNIWVHRDHCGYGGTHCISRASGFRAPVAAGITNRAAGLGGVNLGSEHSRVRAVVLAA